MAGCFLSYSRQDDEPFVERLRDQLVRSGVDVWWDRLAMRSRGTSFLAEIDDAIREVGRVVLVVGPNVAQSDYVAHELVVAEERCTVVVPVLRVGTFDDIPQHLGSRHVFDFRHEPVEAGSGPARVLEQLVTTLAAPPAPPAPLLGSFRAAPSHLIDRSSAVDEVVGMLMRDVEDPVAIAAGASTAAIAGMSGLGKTVLATLVARSCPVRRRFDDGVAIFRLGRQQTPAELIRAIRRLLGDPPDPLEDSELSQTRLRALLSGRQTLLVLDDVWSPAQVDPIVALVAGTGSRVLLTTRNRVVVTGLAATVHDLELPSRRQAADLLAAWHGGVDGRDSYRVLADRCGRLPLALALCGALLQRGMTSVELVEALDAAELGLLDVELAGYEHIGVFAAVEASIQWLRQHDPDAAGGYALLAAFESGDLLPIRVVARLWGARSAAEVRLARRRILELVAASLLVRGSDDSVQLHDVHRAYLVATGSDVPALQRKLLDAYRSGEGWLRAAAGEKWLRQRLVGLLVAAGELDEAVRLLTAEQPEGRNAWHELRTSAGELEGYWADLDALQRALPDLELSERPALAARITAIRSSLRSASANTPAPLIVAAARLGIWPMARVTSMIKRIPHAKDRGEAMMDLLELLDSEQQEWLRELFSTIRELPSGDWSSVVERLAASIAPKRAAFAEQLAVAEIRRLGVRLDFRCVRAAIGLMRLETFPVLRAAVDVMPDDRARRIALASITRLLDDDQARATVTGLLSEADELAERTQVILASASASRAALRDLSSAVLIESVQALAAGRYLPVQGFTQLLAQASHEAVTSAGGDLHLAIARITESTAAYRVLRDLVGCAMRPGLQDVIRLTAEALDPAPYGTALLAATASGDAEDAAWITAEVGDRLSAELARASDRDDFDWLGDVSPCLAGVVHAFPAELVDRLVDGVTRIGDGEMAGRAIAGLAPGLSSATVADLVDGRLRLAERATSFIQVNGVLETLAPVMTSAQVQVALAIGAAPRDNGFEYSWLAVLRANLSDHGRKRVDLWASERAAEHLTASDSSLRGKESEFARLVSDLVSQGTSSVVLAFLADITPTLASPAARAEAAGSLASALPDDQAARWWSVAEEAVEALDVPGARARATARLARLARGERQSKYVRIALSREELLDEEHLRIQALAELPPSSATADRVVHRLRTAWKKDSAWEQLAHLVPAEELAELVDERCWDLNEGRPAMVRRLADAGMVAEAAQQCRTAGGEYLRSRCIEAGAPGLSLATTGELLELEPTHPALLERQSELGELAVALRTAQSLQPGAPRLEAVVRCAKHGPDQVIHRPVATVVGDLSEIHDLDTLWRCLRLGAVQFARLPADERSRACLFALELLGQRIRLQALPGVYLTTPLIAAVGGTAAVEATFAAVVDAARWWPAYPTLES